MHQIGRSRSRKAGRLAFPALFVLGVAIFLLVAAVGAAGASERGAANPDAIVMTVNGSPITAGQFYAQLEKRAGAQVLDMMVTDILIRQAAAANGIVITQDEISQQMAAVKAQFATDEEYQAALKKYGLTEADLASEIELNLVLQRLGTKDITVTDEDITKYFDEHKAEFDTPAKVRARHILLKTEDEAKDVLAQLKAGADFGELAKKYSIDTGSKEGGGELGFFTQDQVVPEFGTAAFALKVGEISGIVQSMYGFHIIQVEERQEAKSATLEETKEQIRQRLIEERTIKPEDVVKALKEKAQFDVKWAEYGDAYGPSTAPAENK